MKLVDAGYKIQCTLWFIIVFTIVYYFTSMIPVTLIPIINQKVCEDIWCSVICSDENIWTDLDVTLQ